ncbi:Transaminase prephenate dehydratase 1-aminocyclopropane-1-carboxylate synthase activity [Phytophthora palmivora]|uniref:Transaminase prephenate dehydratase 1-aminocyclopropane-1-carboxylate synthase activity n=1 Tax=Phytophthora palmivora TaxID=4796 RepID=A0A2P4XX74_9STRA|nr:Transaminase prephenate dehydratase 1-aminocyclopropane-1-carboxylate synthase activity [Phytophthora palmivora]
MAVETSTRIGYQEKFEFAKDAANAMLSTVNDSKSIGYASIEDAVAAVKKEDVKFAVVPVESTAHGSYYDTYDLLLKYDVAVVGESKPSTKSARFWLVAKTPTEPSLKMTTCKTSLAFAFASGNAHGQLHRALGLFASRDIDLSKVESRPL